MDKIDFKNYAIFKYNISEHHVSLIRLILRGSMRRLCLELKHLHHWILTRRRDDAPAWLQDDLLHLFTQDGLKYNLDHDSYRN